MRWGYAALARLGLGAAAVAAVSAGLLGACSAKKNSEIVIAMQTDLSLPKDVDTIRVQVTQGGVDLFLHDYPVGPDGAKIPATLGVVDNPNAPGLPIRVRIIARHQGTLRILRQNLTSIPQDRVGTLRMPIQWLCWNQGHDTGEGGAEPDCDAGESCINGSCQVDQVDPNALGPFDPNQIFGGGDQNGGGVCFDTVACFSHGAMVPVDTSDCTIAPPADPGSGINVAMVRPPGGTGICSDAACFFPLDEDPLFGWSTAADGRIALPPAVCDRLTHPASPVQSLVGVAVTTSCTAKTPSTPPCGPWSSVGGDAGTFTGSPPSGFALDGGTDGSITLPDGGTCDPAKRWPQMLASPIVPPTQIAGLDLSNGGAGDLTVDEAELVNCGGTLSAAPDPGYSALAWGPSGDVFVEFNPTTRIPYSIVVRDAYSGAASFGATIGGQATHVVVGVGKLTTGSTDGTDGGAPITIPWSDGTALNTLTQSLYDGYMQTFLPVVTPDADCISSGDCFANAGSPSGIAIAVHQRFPLYIVFPQGQSVPNELYTLWADGALGAGGKDGGTSTQPDSGAPSGDGGGGGGAKSNDASAGFDAN